MLPTTQPRKRPTNQKRKGNNYENRTSKRLSVWMFGDPTILYRHEDSGARKIVYTGDIIPKNTTKYPWKIYPFVIECKNGYKDNIPNLMNQNHLRSWLTKLLDERTDEQRIPLFIAQYHHQIPILLTTIILKYPYTLALALQYNDTTEFFYVYQFNELLKLDFMSVVPDWFEEVVKIQHSEIQPVEDIQKNISEPLNIEVQKNISEPLNTDELNHISITEMLAKDEPLPKSKKSQSNIKHVEETEEKQISKQEQNKILGEIIADIMGF